VRVSAGRAACGPAHAAATAGLSIQEGEIPRETDCLLERNGFELPVPRQIGNGFEASSKCNEDFPPNQLRNTNNSAAIL
jgi:hypothetical protein